MSNEASKFMQGVKTVKRVSIALIVGSALGAFGIYNYIGNRIAHFQNVAAQGNCGNRDIEGTYYWVSCAASRNIDAAIASVMQQRDIEADYAEAEAIARDMGRKKNGGRR